MLKYRPENSMYSMFLGPFCTAVLLYLSFSFSHFTSCIWIAFIPLCCSTRGQLPKRAFIQGLIAGSAFYYFNLYWVTNSIRNFSDLTPAFSLIILALLALYLSLYFGLFSFLLAKNPVSSWPSILYLASCWTLLEWLRGTLFVGFPWNNLGIALSPHSPFNRLLPYGGIYSLTFLIITTNLILYSLIFHHAGNHVLPRRAVAVLAIPLLYIILLSGSHTGTANLDTSRPIMVSIIQPNIPQEEKWDPAFRQRNFSILEQMSLETTSPSKIPHLVIWPEASLPDFYQDAPSFQQRISTLTRRGNFFLLVGSPQYNTDSANKHHYFNTAMLFSPAGILIDSYSKIKLVPFGEFTPLAHYFPFLGKMVPGADFSAGKQHKPMRMGHVSLAPSICYEGIFPEFIATMMAHKAGFIVNITNDAWFGISSGPRQHLRNVQTRAMEERCYLLRCANTGISAIIKPDGQILKKLALGTRGKLEAVIYPAADPTWYARHPRLLIVLLSVMAAGMKIYERARPAPR